MKNEDSLDKDKFLELSLKSNKWEKWMINKDFASDFHKAIISGHYVFASDEFKDIVNSAVSYLGKDLEYLNDRLKKIIINTIKKYILNFNYKFIIWEKACDSI